MYPQHPPKADWPPLNGIEDDKGCFQGSKIQGGHALPRAHLLYALHLGDNSLYDLPQRPPKVSHAACAPGHASAQTHPRARCAALRSSLGRRITSRFFAHLEIHVLPDQLVHCLLRRAQRVDRLGDQLAGLAADRTRLPLPGLAAVPNVPKRCVSDAAAAFSGASVSSQQTRNSLSRGYRRQSTARKALRFFETEEFGWASVQEPCLELRG